MRNTQYAYWKRKWLNRKGFHSTAFIYATVEQIELVGADSYFLDGDITLSDCGKQITLDFYSNSQAEYKNNLSKLDTLISTLQEFRDVYVNEWEHRHED